MSLVRRLFPEPDQREASFLGDLFRRETVGGAIALVAAVVGVVWANSAVGVVVPRRCGTSRSARSTSSTGRPTAR